MPKGEIMKCEIKGCPNEWKYKLNKITDKTKRWIKVCLQCEKEIGMENLRRVDEYSTIKR